MLYSRAARGPPPGNTLIMRQFDASIKRLAGFIQTFLRWDKLTLKSHIHVDTSPAANVVITVLYKHNAENQQEC